MNKDNLIAAKNIYSELVNMGFDNTLCAGIASTKVICKSKFCKINSNISFDK